MANSKKELIEQCVKIIQDKKLHFIQDLVVELPIGRTTFYGKGLNKADKIRDALEKNKINLKRSLRHKWFNSDNPALQITLYRLLADKDEFDRITQKQVIQTNLNKNIDNEKFIDDEKLTKGLRSILSSRTGTETVIRRAVDRQKEKQA